MNKLKISILTLILHVLLSCLPQNDGSLYINSPYSGEFEIFKIDKQKQVIISQNIGLLNTATKLEAGQYLILGDCSSKTITIAPNKLKKISTTTVEFIAPDKTEKNTKFSIKCRRNKTYNHHQSLSNRYKLSILPNNHDLIINMSKMKINEQNRKIFLGSLTLKAYARYKSMLYYVSPIKNPSSTILSQNINDSLLLLPGKYQITINGTSKTIELHPGENKTIYPSYIKVKNTNLEDYKIASVLINNKTPINFNDTYPILNNKIALSLKDSYTSTTTNLQTKKLTTVNTNSIIAKKGCSPWEWECIGKTEMYLYQKTNLKLLQKGHSDIFLPYFPQDVFLSFKGSEGLYYEIPRNNKNNKIYLGSIVLVPLPKHKNGLLTDLAHITSANKKIVGTSKDIAFTHKTTMNLVSGKYTLSLYTSNSEYKATKKELHFSIYPGKSSKLKFYYYTHKRKMKERMFIYNKEKNNIDDMQIQALKDILY
jgi:hypothetical protein